MKKLVKINKVVRKNIALLAGTFLALLISVILKINLVIPVALILLVIYLQFLYLNLSAQPFRLLNLIFLFVILFAVTYVVARQGWSVLATPFCVIPMLATILFNELVVSLLITVASSIIITTLTANNFYLGMLFFTSGILSNILVFGVRKRNTIIQAGFIIGIVQAATLLLIDQFRMYQPERYLFLFGNGIVSGIIVLGVLPIFEYLFSTITNISLLELADFNHPILNRMMLEAPGTYHHSLIVGNLSDGACGAIGANSLLARIGAYYHDIGKLQKPEYFSENQSIKGNKHDALSPSMSKLVIMNHVKDGVELAHKYKLNPRLVDFIQYHHGNSLVYFFYRRALENVEEDQEIKEERFRYPGPKPNTKETATVMLADSVEAAARTLKEPTPAKIEELVHKIVNNKFIDGQLDECELTLKDLEKISSVFIRILSGIYHARVNYPDEKREPH